MMNNKIDSYRRRLTRITKAGSFSLGCLVALSQVHAQPTPAVAEQTKFEVASVKRSEPTSRLALDYSPSGRFTATGMTMKRLIMWAYNLGTPAVSGGASWVDSKSDKYDIVAKAPNGSITGAVGKGMELGGDTARGLSWMVAWETPGGRQLRSMVQALLADRFQLKVHSETRQLSVYNLVLGKNGPRFHEAQSESAPRVSFTMGQLTFQNAPLTFLITILTELNGRPVLDQTALTGQYDFTLRWTPDRDFRRAEAGNESAAQPDLSDPSLFTALQEQLGLKLEPAKGPVQVLVIDHVERPSEN
jgi:uncharacterized protein (TIGR03435 family)